MTQYKQREETQAIDALVLSFMHAISSFLCLPKHSNLDSSLYKPSRYWSRWRVHMLHVVVLVLVTECRQYIR